MQTKNQFLDYIQQVKSILNADDVKSLGIQDRGLFTDIKDDTGKVEKSLETQIIEAELIVPVVGGFSAGKSTLINSFLQRAEDLLPTAITAETALAAELRYNSNSEYIEAVTENNETIKYSLSDFPKIKDNAQNYSYLRIYLNNNNLKAIQPLVLVDMPGFGATNENHDKAIQQYLCKGSYFVFLNSAIEDCTIKSDMEQQIKKLNQIGKGFSFCLSKVNLKSPEDIEELKENMEELLEDYDLDDEIEVITLDLNGGENLRKILKDINPESLFRKMFIEKLTLNNEKIIEAINQKITVNKLNEEDIQESITQLEKSITDIKAKQQEQIQNIEQNYSNNSANTVVNAICAKLIEETSSLASLAVSNECSFKNRIEEIVRSSSQDQLMQEFKKIAEVLLAEFKLSIESGSKFNISGLTLDTNFLTKFNNQISEMLQKTDTSFDINEVMKNTKGILSLLLKTISPLLSTIIALIPDSILSFFFGSKQDTRNAEQEAKNKAGSLIVSQVIPEIRKQLDYELPLLLNTQVKNLITELTNEYLKEINDRICNIEETKSQKSQDINVVQENINKLVATSEKISNLANTL